MLYCLLLLSGWPLGASAQQLTAEPDVEVVSPTMATVSVQLSQKARVYVHLANNSAMNNARLFQPVHVADSGLALHFELSGLLPEKTYHAELSINGKTVKQWHFSTLDYETHYANLKASSTSASDDTATTEAAVARTPAAPPPPAGETPEQVADSVTDTTIVDSVITVDPLDTNMDSLIAGVSVAEEEKEAEEQATAAIPPPATENKGLKPNADDSIVADLPEFNPPINAKAYGLVVQPTLGYTFIKIYMNERDQLSPQSQVVIFDNRGVDLKRVPQVIRQNGIQGIDLKGLKPGRYFVRMEALDGTAIWGEFNLR